MAGSYIISGPLNLFNNRKGSPVTAPSHSLYVISEAKFLSVQGRNCQDWTHDFVRKLGIELAEFILSRIGVLIQDILLLCVYRAQADEVDRMLQRKNMPKCRVGTIDGSQGGEADITI